MSYWMLIIVTMVIGFATQGFINSSYRKYAAVDNETGYTGAQIARRMLDDNGLHDVEVQCVAGTLTDHYDPRTRVVRLSEGIYATTSVSAMAVACHECGHAVQHARGYVPMTVRSALVPLANFGSSTWLLLLIAGMFLGLASQIGYYCFMAALVLYGFAVLFQLVTLPVEFNASRRGMQYIHAGAGTGYLLEDGKESGARTVLTAAALTYVAAALTSVMQLLYYLNIANRR